MADSEVFDFVCSELENRTSLDRLEARGTVRIALKQAGLEARNVTVEQMSVAVDKLLPAELSTRGVDDAPGQCAQIKSGLAGLSVTSGGETPEAVFERLGG